MVKMNKKILIGSIIAVLILMPVCFPTVIGDSKEIGNNRMFSDSI